ncbi:hypothetical protein FRC19_004500 [Serendipita sp. 401]|nr:hypothetical protein FRC19_004500 [Serendipita sp. 401]
MASTQSALGPRWRKAYEQFSRTRLPVPTMSLSPPSEKHRFPPTELLDMRKPGVAAHWESLQPPPNSALIALAHRMGIAGIFSSSSTSTTTKSGKVKTVDDEQMALLIRQACTHDSFARRHAAMYPNESPPPTNGMLASLGNTLLGLFTVEFIHASYPHLPTRVLKAATAAYVGHQSCANVAQELGIAPLVRWHRQVLFSSSDEIPLFFITIVSRVRTCLTRV